MVVSGLYIYPVKSLGGISLVFSEVTSRGLQYDRRWMLVDENNKFLTQREFPHLALFKTTIENDSIIIFNAGEEADKIKLPLSLVPSFTIPVTIWEDTCRAQLASDEINEWFSRKLSMRCRAVYMPESTKRKTDPAYSITGDDITSFSDGYPILLIGQASLDDLNSRLEIPVPMNRFRPNIVFTGGRPYEEDGIQAFKINAAWFDAVKLCGRCIITSTDQDTAERGKEPLKTLATYRTINNKVCFGQNIICKGNGPVRIGDKIDF